MERVVIMNVICKGKQEFMNVMEARNEGVICLRRTDGQTLSSQQRMNGESGYFVERTSAGLLKNCSTRKAGQEYGK